MEKSLQEETLGRLQGEVVKSYQKGHDRKFEKLLLREWGVLLLPGKFGGSKQRNPKGQP